VLADAAIIQYVSRAVLFLQPMVFNNKQPREGEFMTFQKTKLVLGIATAALTLAGALVAPEAMAATKSKSKVKTIKVKKVVKKKVVKSKKQVSNYPVSSSYGVGTRVVGSSDVAALQTQVSDLRNQVSQLQAQVAGKADNSAKVQELDQWMNQVKAEPKKVETKDNLVFFRGGFGHSNKPRNGVSIQSDVVSSQNSTVNGVVSGGQADKDAWYMGAGFDFSIDDNLFGLSDNTQVMAELMFDYKEFQTVQGNAFTNTNNVIVSGVAGGLGVTTPLNGPLTNPGRNVTVNQLTLAASPKIKFMKDSDLRPWIIPAGFALQIVSPPTESITVLQPAMMFGVGADYRLWKNIYIGADARYHFGLGGTMDGVNTNGFTAGGYLGLGF
jgi:hypothetical protein